MLTYGPASAASRLPVENARAKRYKPCSSAVTASRVPPHDVRFFPLLLAEIADLVIRFKQEKRACTPYLLSIVLERIALKSRAKVPCDCRDAGLGSQEDDLAIAVAHLHNRGLIHDALLGPDQRSPANRVEYARSRDRNGPRDFEVRIRFLGLFGDLKGLERVKYRRHSGIP